MFKSVLNDVLQKTEGCVGVVIMGTDGIPVEQVWKQNGPETNLDIAVAEFTTLLRNAQRTSNDMGLGSLRELMVMCDTTAFIMRLINTDYFLVLALNPDGNLGRGRYELRCAEVVLEREFVV